VKDTHEFVENLNETQKKDEKNKQRQGQGDKARKLPNKQHSTNK
jgi:hypothetical protein